MPLQIRRGTDAERNAMTTKLANGEILWVTDDKKLYIGDGTTASSALVPVTGFNAEDAVDSVGAALVAGSHKNVSFLYGTTQDNAGRIDAVVDLSNYVGVIEADAFKGSLFADTSVTMVDSLTATFNLDGTVGTKIVPNSNGTIDIGTTSYRFKDLYLSGSSHVYIGSAAITAGATGINLPAGSTIDGAPLGGFGTGSSLRVDIIGDDSSIIVNTSNNSLHGTLTGNVTGSVYSTGSALLVDATNNRIPGTLVGNVTTTAGSPVLTTATKTATLNEIALQSSGIVSGTQMTVTALSTVFATQTGSASTPFVSVVTATGASALAASVVGARSRGSLISPSAVQLNDEMGKFEFSGHDGADYRLSAGLIGLVNGTVSSTIVPSRLELFVTDGAGAQVTPIKIKPTTVEFTTQASFPDGTASAPSIAFTTDGGVDTGFSHPGDGVIVVSSNTVEVARFDGGGIRSTGFIKVAQVNGTLPSPAEAGMIVLDGTTFKGYNGSGWVNLN